MKIYPRSWLSLATLVCVALALIVPTSKSTQAAGPWYVAPGGNDASSCLSSGSPCATINGAIGKATAGDTIYVAEGTYTASTEGEVVLINKSVTLSGGWDGGFTVQNSFSVVDVGDFQYGINVNSFVTALVEYFIVRHGLRGIVNAGNLTLANSAVRDRDNAYGDRAIFNHGGPLTLTNSAISGSRGYAIYNWDSVLTLNNSTIGGNDGTGLANDGGTVVLNNTTISGNTGGVTNSSGTVTLQNTIVAGNGVPGVDADCIGPISSAGYNLIGSTSGCIFTATVGDLTNVNPMLWLLVNSPAYYPLLLSSPAIDAGNPAGCLGSDGLLTTDQRGIARYGRCDIGAYEWHPLDFSTKTVSPTTATRGAVLTYTLTLTNGGAISLPNVVLTDTLPSSLTYIGQSLTATAGSFGYAAGVVTWNGSLNAGELVTVTFGATVSQTAPLGTSVVNSATISGSGANVTRIAIVNIPLAKVYLPLAWKPKPRSGINGTVTENGVPAAGVSLALRFYNGSSWSTYTTTNTDADGDYFFTGVPSLGAGQAYYVLFQNTFDGNPNRLWTWHTRSLTSYTGSSTVAIGNFDLANIALVSPADVATVSVPRTFQWTPRPASPTDVYEFDLYDPVDLDPYIYPVVGHAGSYTLNSLPSGFHVGDVYFWEIWVYNGDGAYGISFETRWVYFSNAGLSAAEDVPVAPHKNVPDLVDRYKR